MILALPSKTDADKLKQQLINDNWFIINPVVLFLFCFSLFTFKFQSQFIDKDFREIGNGEYFF